MITLNNLSHALALRKHKSFRKAAEARHLSQPAFSRSIQKLEELLGVKLFDRQRGAGAVTPTLYGESLLNRAKSIFEETRELEREIKILKGLNAGSLSIAMGNYVAELSASQAIGELVQLHPNLKFQAKVANWRNVAQLVLSHSVDIGIAEISASKNIKYLKIVPVAEKELLLFCRQGHPLLKLEKLTKADIDKYNLAMLRLPPQVADIFPGKTSIDEKTGDGIPSIEVDELATARTIVLASNAIGVTTALQIEPWLNSGELAILPFRAPWLKLDYGFIYLKDRLLSPAAEIYMQLVKDIEKEQTIKNSKLTKKIYPDSPKK